MKPRILVVEDEILLGLDLKKDLLALNFDLVEFVGSLESALNYLDARQFDLVLIDIHAKDKIDGIEVARVIQEKYRIPILFITAYMTSEIIHETKKAKTYGYLLKPYKIDELKAIIEVALYKHQAEHNKEVFNKQIKRAEKHESLRAMAGGIAHKFNNSIHVVLGNLSLALRSLPPEFPERKLLFQAEKAAWEASELSRQMLSFSGNIVTEQIEINLSVFVTQLHHLLKALLPSNVELEVQLADDLPVIIGDPIQLKQVVFAVVMNAIESYGKRKGSVFVKTTQVDCVKEDLIPIRFGRFLQEGCYVNLEILDFGCGMEKDVVKKVFDPFYSTKFIGRGLGLPVALGIIQSHNGSIKIVSNVSEGTSVNILIPAVNQSENISNTSFSSSESLKNKLKTILVVDDEEIVLLVTQTMLKRAGFTVITASSGKEAIKSYSEHYEKISCVLLDSTMPGLGTISIVKRLHEISSAVKVILCSGYEEQEATKGLQKDLFVTFIKKPFSMSTLVEKLSREI